MMTPMEVLDTAVKIGLGAGITGVASVFIARQNHDRELRKFAFTRRCDNLEQVTEKAEASFAAWWRYCSYLCGIYSGQYPPDPDFSASQWERVRKMDMAFLDTRDALGLAVARLRLLGLTHAADLIDDYNTIVGEFRDPMILQMKTPTHEQFKEFRARSGDSIRSFYASISSAYLSQGS